ncbi:MAG TPA: CRISPR-associated endoribonuclease Cas6 [Dehalococcoidia bacterium]|nr:CRISPR-associated endoribonuclease Cas6 [Dehalococcoidia bacterium]
MRLKLTLDAGGPFLLPWRYPELLRGAVYAALRRWDPELARTMHGQGLVAAGRRYKPFTYSWLHPKVARKHDDGLLMEPPAYWWISSPLPQVLEAVAGPLLTAGHITLGHVRLAVALVEVEPQPDISPPCEVETLSPIVVSTAAKRGNKLSHVFLAPWEDEFQRVLTQNLANKAHALGLPVADGAWVRLEPLGEVRSRLVEVNETKVKGYYGRFRATGDPALLALGYDMGFGERNAQGFGMVALSKG